MCHKLQISCYNQTAIKTLQLDKIAFISFSLSTFYVQVLISKSNVLIEPAKHHDFVTLLELEYTQVPFLPYVPDIGS